MTAKAKLATMKVFMDVIKFMPVKYDQYADDTHKGTSFVRQKVWLGKAAKLFPNMLANNATANDICDILTFGVVCRDEARYCLSIDKARADLGIDELLKKYGRI